MKKIISIFLLLVGFMSCSDNDDAPASGLPIEGLQMPSRETVFTTGQAVTIKGKGFTDQSQIWLNVITKAEGDIQAEVTEVNGNSVTFTVPENVNGEKEVVLIQDGKTYPLGKLFFESIPVYGRTLYGHIKQEGFNPVFKFAKIDIETGKTNLITELENYKEKNTYDIAYLASTQEIISNISDGILKYNIKSGKSSFIPVSEGINDICSDHKENLYAHIYSPLPSASEKIVKINKDNGTLQIIAEKEVKTDEREIYQMVYSPATNEIIALLYNNIWKINATSGALSVLPLEASVRLLVCDENGNMYGTLSARSAHVEQIVKINSNTGELTPITSVEMYREFDQIVYLPSTKEIIGIDYNNTLFRINVETKAIKSVPCTEEIAELIVG